MADTKLTGLTEDTSPALTDITYGVKDPAGTPLSRKLTWQTVWNLLTSLTAKTTLANGDKFSISDSAASNVAKNITWQNLMGQAAAYAQTLTSKTLTTPVINSATGIWQPIYIIKAADETVNNSATLQNDDHFSFAIAANEKWLVEMFVVITSPSANSDYQFDFTFPASCEVRYGVTNNAASLLSWGHAAAAGTTTGLATASTAITVGGFNGTWGAAIVGVFSNSTNAGTIQYRWAQGTMTAENTVEKANSIMRYTRLA